MTMKLNINKVVVSALVAALSFASCDDWTETESLNIHNPSIQDQNPELYAQYVKSLNDFKATDHQVVIASIDNVSTAPAARNQHLTNLPDSIDYLCLNNTAGVSEANQAEIEEVRKLGTKVLGLVNFDAIESAWKAILEEEAENGAANPEAAEGEEEGEETVDNAARFIEYCKSEVAKQIAASNALGVDGIIANYTGFDLNALVEEDAIAAETARQAAFFDAIAEWKNNNAAKVLIFKGLPQNVMGKDLLSACKYIIVNAHSANNQYEMSYLILMASAQNVPTDRFVIGVTTPYLTNSGAYNGKFGDGSSAIIGAAQWVVATTPDYTKAGISIDGAEQDYFNIEKIYPNIREAINILSPTVK